MIELIVRVARLTEIRQDLDGQIINNQPYFRWIGFDSNHTQLKQLYFRNQISYHIKMRSWFSRPLPFRASLIFPLLIKIIKNSDCIQFC